MKKSELRQIIREEIQNLLEIESSTKINVSTRKFEFSHGKKPKGDGGWIFKIGSEEWEAPGRNTYGKAVTKAKAYAKKKGATEIEVMP